MAWLLLRELKRRKVPHTCFLYVILCWVILQVSDIVTPAMSLDSDAINLGLLVAAILGFPVCCVIAWFYQITSDGIVRTAAFAERRLLNNIEPATDRCRSHGRGPEGETDEKHHFDWMITAESGPLEGLAFGIPESLILGRALDCELTVISSHISRRHARLHIADGQLTVEDLGSANGTFVNGEKTEGITMLHHGDELDFQGVRFRIVESYSTRSEQVTTNRTTVVAPLKQED